MTRFVDLSIPITNDVISDPEVMRPQITYMTHEATWEQIAMFFPGLRKEDLPDGEGWAVEMLQLSTHNGTHMDAPWHYHSTTNSGANPAPSIDEAPLDRFFRPGVKLDFSHRPHGHVVSAAELEVVGTDAWSWDAPFSHTARRWAESRDPAIIWEGHKAGRIRPYYQIEKLTNLDSLPPHGFTFSCFPVKIERASAGWIRAVAIIED